MPMSTPQTPQGIPGMLDPSQSVMRRKTMFTCDYSKNWTEGFSITIILNFQVQTKAALKGWSALTGDKTGSTPQSAGPKKVDIQYLSSVFDCIEECYHFKLVLTIFVGVN